MDDSQPLVDSRLPARKIWNPSSRALVNPYEFVEEPEDRPYGIDAGFRDPFGNHLRLTQVKELAGV